MAQQIIGQGCPGEKIKFHRLGVDLDLLPCRPRKWTPGETLRVLIAATFCEKKGIPYAIEALGLLAADIDLEITVIGDALPHSREMGEQEKILDMINRFRLADRNA